MPTRGRPALSHKIPGAYAVSTEIRGGTIAAPVTFHVVASSQKEFYRTLKWQIERLPGNDKLEFKLTPAHSKKEVTICQMIAKSVPDSRAVRVEFKGPVEMNPKGHLDRPKLLGTSRRVRLALHQSDRAYA